MNKAAALNIVNPLLAAFFLNQAVTGILADEILAHSPMAFAILHQGGGYCLIALVIIHVYLNWNWVNLNYSSTSSADVVADDQADRRRSFPESRF